MPILGNATVVAAAVSRSTSNALRVQLKAPDGTELAHARQKGGVGVLLGLKNGGKSTYTLSGTNGEELMIAVADATTITRASTPVGRIVPSDGAVRFEDGGGMVLAVARPHHGLKADSGWHHQILSPGGQELGVLTLMTSHSGWGDVASDVLDLLGGQSVTTLTAPSAGTMLRLAAPVPAAVGDVLAAACVDFAVLPRGYVV